MKKFFMMLALACGLVAVTSACSSKAGDSTCDHDCDSTCTKAGCADSAAVETADASSAVKTLTDDNLLRPDMKVERLTVIDFNATWCGPCRMLTPSFDAVAEELHSQADFYSVDIDNMKATADAFGIQAIPAIVVLSPDAPTRTYVGLDPYLKGVDLDKVESNEALTAILTPAFRTVITGQD